VSSATGGATATPAAHRDTDARPDADADHPGRGAIDRDRDPPRRPRPPPPTESVTSPAPASPSAAASGGSSGTNLLWLWILLGVLILAGLITWIATSGRRRQGRPQPAGGRGSSDAYAKGSALHDAMSVAEVQGDLGSRRRPRPGGMTSLAPGGRPRPEPSTRCARRPRIPRDQARDRGCAPPRCRRFRSAMDAERAPRRRPDRSWPRLSAAGCMPSSRPCARSAADDEQNF